MRVRLDPTAAETRRVRAAVMEEAWRRRFATPAAAAGNDAAGRRSRRRGPFSSWGGRRVGVAVGFALIAGLTVGSSAFAASRAGGPLYDARLALEDLTLPTDPTARLEAKLAEAQGRVADIVEAASRGDNGAVQAAVRAYGSTLADLDTEQGAPRSCPAPRSASTRSCCKSSSRGCRSRPRGASSRLWTAARLPSTTSIASPAASRRPNPATPATRAATATATRTARATETATRAGTPTGMPAGTATGMPAGTATVKVTATPARPPRLRQRPGDRERQRERPGQRQHPGQRQARQDAEARELAQAVQDAPAEGANPQRLTAGPCAAPNAGNAPSAPLRSTDDRSERVRLTVLGAGPAYSDREGASGASYLVTHETTQLLLDLGHGSFSASSGPRCRPTSRRWSSATSTPITSSTWSRCATTCASTSSRRAASASWDRAAGGPARRAPRRPVVHLGCARHGADRPRGPPDRRPRAGGRTCRPHRR